MSLGSTRGWATLTKLVDRQGQTASAEVQVLAAAAADRSADSAVQDFYYSIVDLQTVVVLLHLANTSVSGDCHSD